MSSHLIVIVGIGNTRTCLLKLLINGASRNPTDEQLRNYMVSRDVACLFWHRQDGIDVPLIFFISNISNAISIDKVPFVGVKTNYFIIVLIHRNITFLAWVLKCFRMWSQCTEGFCEDHFELSLGHVKKNNIYFCTDHYSQPMLVYKIIRIMG